MMRPAPTNGRPLYKTLETIAPLSDNAMISVLAIASSPARPMPVAAG
jgi:hypothetical protein